MNGRDTRLSGRLGALERQAVGERAGPQARLRENERRERAAFLALVPDDLRERVEARLDEPYGPDTEPLAGWMLWPFARWARPLPPGFALPRALVAWVLDPPRRFWFGHHCGTCGLTVPLFTLRSDDPDPPTDLRVFPLCPACGGVTSHAAAYRPDPPTAVENRQ